MQFGRSAGQNAYFTVVDLPDRTGRDADLKEIAAPIWALPRGLSALLQIKLPYWTVVAPLYSTRERSGNSIPHTPSEPGGKGCLHKEDCRRRRSTAATQCSLSAFLVMARISEPYIAASARRIT